MLLLLERINVLRVDFPKQWSGYLTDKETALVLLTLANALGKEKP
jgi:hypothetical protein